MSVAFDVATLYVEVAFENAFDETPTFTDITSVVRGEVLIRRGRQSELETTQPGTLTFTVDNRTRAFDPFNTGSAYYPYVEPMKAVRVRLTFFAQTETLFYGYIDSFAQQYDDPDAVCVVTATDASKVLANTVLPSVYEIEVMKDAPKAWYRLDEVDGAIMADSSGNGYDGVYEGTINTTTSHASLLTDDNNPAITFDGSTMRGIVSNPAVRVTALPFAVECWFLGPATGSLAGEPVAFQGSGSSHDGWQFQIFGGATTALFSGAFYPTDSNPRTTASVNITYPRHIVYRRTAAPVHEIYVDGVAASSAGGASYGDAFTGLYVMGNPKISQFYTDGTLDELAIYNTDLTTTRITEHYHAGTRPWYGDLTGARATKILDAAGWLTGLRDIDTGESVLGAAHTKDVTALDYLRLIAESENGNFYCLGDGTIKFRSRSAIQTEARYTTSNATFNDDGGTDLQYTNLTFAPSDHWIRNDIRIQRYDGTTQTATDATSKSRYMTKGFSRTGLLNSSDSEMRDQANYLLARYKDPVDRVETLEFTPRAQGLLWGQVLLRELEDRVTVIRNPPGGGDPITYDVHIEQIEHRFSVDGDWHTTWTLSPAETSNYWIWDTSTWDGGDRWGY